jgi:hypothetical protein
MSGACSGVISAPGLLVLDGQRSTTTLSGAWCEKGPKGLRYLVGDRYSRPRCKRRDCPRCWALRSRETARCLVLDSERSMPTHCITLTTNDPATTAATYRHGSFVLFRRLRRLYGRVDYFGAIEFTTGRAARSGGYRRMHGHYLVKFPDANPDVLALEPIVRSSWEAVTGAYRVEVAALISPGAALGYLGLHHRKPEQAPPAEWRGMTERASRGYWSLPIEALRLEARTQLAIEAIAHVQGLTLEEARLALAARPEIRLRRVREPIGGRSIITPMGELVRPKNDPEAIAAARERNRRLQAEVVALVAAFVERHPEFASDKPR